MNPQRTWWGAPALLLALVGCAKGPVSYTAPTPEPAETAYVCALRKVNELGYTVTNTSKEGAFIQADKQTSNTFGRLMTGNNFHDRLTISVFDAGNNTRTVRVTAGGYNERSNLLGTSTNSTESSDTAKADSNTILLACAKGPVIKQAGDDSFEASAP
jgi:VCBS repeat-containing protein